MTRSAPAFAEKRNIFRGDVVAAAQKLTAFALSATTCHPSDDNLSPLCRRFLWPSGVSNRNIILGRCIERAGQVPGDISACLPRSSADLKFIGLPMVDSVFLRFTRAREPLKIQDTRDDFARRGRLGANFQRLRQGCRNQIESTQNGALDARIGRKSSVFQWFFKGNQSTVFKLGLKNPLPVTLWIT